MTDIDPADQDRELTDRLIEAVKHLSLQRKKMLEELLNEWERLDYREDSRIPCFLPVDFSTASRVYQDFIHNLSNGGVFIETAAPIKAGQPISMIFTVPSLEKTFKVTGTIVRSERDGIGVKFNKKLTPYQKELIHSALNR